MIRGYRVWDVLEKRYTSNEKNYYLMQDGFLWRWLNSFDGESHLQGLPENLFIVEFDTDLKDKNGKKIYEGDILRFDDDNGIWQAPVTFERGLFGLDVHHLKQVKNPDGWDKDYDKVESRGWAVQWGYEETGTAFTYRTPLAKATIFRGSPEEYEKSEQKKLYEKFGYGDYYVMAEVIGNVHENPELLEGENDN